MFIKGTVEPGIIVAGSLPSQRSAWVREIRPALSLSASALIVLNEMGYESQTVQGAYCWCYKGETLTNLRYQREG